MGKSTKIWASMIFEGWATILRVGAHATHGLQHLPWPLDIVLAHFLVFFQAVDFQAKRRLLTVNKLFREIESWMRWVMWHHIAYGFIFGKVFSFKFSLYLKTDTIHTYNSCIIKRIGGCSCSWKRVKILNNGDSDGDDDDKTTVKLAPLVGFNWTFSAVLSWQTELWSVSFSFFQQIKTS